MDQHSDNGIGRSTPSDWLFRLVPAFDSLRTYSLGSFRLDLFAGLTVAAVAVPQAMAYASIAGVPVAHGLYTAIIMTAVGAMLDSSRQLINGPTNAICIALASAIAFLPVDDHEQRLQVAILMAFLVGLFQTSITLLRLGDLTRFISNSVIVGFTLGAAILLAMDQSRTFLGIPAQGASDDHFVVRFCLTMVRIDLINVRAVGIGATTILLALAIRYLGNRIKSQLPDFLIVVALMAIAVWALGWDRGDAKVAIIGDMGDIPAGLPSFRLPNLDWSMIRQIVTSSLAIAVLGLLEAVAMAKSIAARTGQKLDMNQQCLSEGLANLVGSFFQCIPGSGSLTRSAINVQAGAVSQWSGVISAIAVALIVIAFAPLVKYIPRSCLAGLLILSAYRLVDRKHLMYHLRSTRFDMQIVLATAFAAFAINIEFCILIGVFLSVVLYINRAARLHLTELTLAADRVIRERGPDDPRCDRILIYSLEGELFFGSGPDLEKHFESIANQAVPVTRVIVLRLKRVRNPDAVCLELIERFIVKMRERDINVVLCGVRADLADTMRVCGLEAQLGKDYLFVERETVWSSTLEAVRFAYGLLQGDLCANCPRRNDETQTLYYMI